MIYITGDLHREWTRLQYICNHYHTSREDILIILGDVGVNYYGDERDERVKIGISTLPITLFCIQGNHEQRPTHFPSYERQSWNGGDVWWEPAYDNLFFAIDGQVYDLAGQKTVVIGGAYSVDKVRRILWDMGWWDDEQPSAEIRADVERRLDQAQWRVDVVLSHTVPLKYEPVEMFIPGIDQRSVDKTTETWLDTIEDRLDYRRWYAGHYHTEKSVDRIRLMFMEVEVFAAGMA